MFTNFPSLRVLVHLVSGGKRCAPHRRPDLLLLFLARTFGVPPHGRPRHSCVVVPSLRGVTWVRTAFFSRILVHLRFPIFLSKLFSLKFLFFVADFSRHRPVDLVDRVPPFIETNRHAVRRALPGILTHDLAGCFLFPPCVPVLSLWPRAVGNHGPRPLWEPGPHRP